MVYKFSIGLKKVLKNTLVTYGVPALLFVLNSYQEWMSAETATIAAPFIAMVCYGIKNYMENRKK